MNTAIKHDDGNLIWFNYDNLDFVSLEKMQISQFDITNMPVETISRDILGYPKRVPCYFDLKNYYVTFFKDSKSTTGYSCMCLNKNKEIYKSKAGYINGKPSSKEY